MAPAIPEPVNSATIAGAALSMALFDAMLAQNLLTTDAALAVLSDVQERLTLRAGTNANIQEAALLIGQIHERVAKGRP
jgi:hypothetical protein